MKKLLWVAVGIGIGFLAAQQLAKARNTTPARAADTFFDRLADTADSVSESFRQGMDAREAELRASLGVEDAPSGRRAAR